MNKTQTPKPTAYSSIGVWEYKAPIKAPVEIKQVKIR
jgi:hypothetical protein